jgi:uncharacterized Rossmann fold enzyme
MQIDEWLRWYNIIKDTFHYSIVDDTNASILLSMMIKGRELSIDTLKGCIEGKDVLIFGAGPSLLQSLHDIIANGIRIDALTLIACDGASQALIEHGIKPDIVVTDLDGNHEYLLTSDTLGAVMVVHAHADNVNLMRYMVPKLRNIIATTQVKPLHNVYNFGGFTDGDRAVFLASEFNARSIILAGMDFGYEVGYYSKRSYNIGLKVAKMQFAKMLLESLAEECKGKGIKLYNLSSSRIKGFENIDVVGLNILAMSK